VTAVTLTAASLVWETSVRQLQACENLFLPAARPSDNAHVFRQQTVCLQNRCNAVV